MIEELAIKFGFKKIAWMLSCAEKPALNFFLWGLPFSIILSSIPGAIAMAITKSFNSKHIWQIAAGVSVLSFTFCILTFQSVCK